VTGGAATPGDTTTARETTATGGATADDPTGRATAPDNATAGGSTTGETVAADATADSPADDATSRGETGLARLRFTGLEAAAIAALAADGDGDTLVATGLDANRQRVMAGELAPYRVVHFATHGVLDSEHPVLSGLALSMVDAHGQPQQGFLHLADLYDLHLDADLVVLSGCRTALGREIRGEGLVGLVRGFLYAGTPRVVASLWQVQDRATAELMTRFYRALWQEGLSPAAALREAQESIRGERRWRDPYYWAGFVLVGEWH
jgi:CHAT domain-containing protein